MKNSPFIQPTPAHCAETLPSVPRILLLWAHPCCEHKSSFYPRTDLPQFLSALRRQLQWFLLRKHHARCSFSAYEPLEAMCVYWIYHTLRWKSLVSTDIMWIYHAFFTHWDALIKSAKSAKSGIHFFLTIQCGGKRPNFSHQMTGGCIKHVKHVKHQALNFALPKGPQTEKTNIKIVARCYVRKSSNIDSTH